MKQYYPRSNEGEQLLGELVRMTLIAVAIWLFIKSIANVVGLSWDATLSIIVGLALYCGAIGTTWHFELCNPRKVAAVMLPVLYLSFVPALYFRACLGPFGFSPDMDPRWMRDEPQIWFGMWYWQLTMFFGFVGLAFLLYKYVDKHY